MINLTTSEIEILKGLKEKFNGDFSRIKASLDNDIKDLLEKEATTSTKIKELKDKIDVDPTSLSVEHDPTTGSDFYYAQLLYWRKYYKRLLKKLVMLRHITKLSPIAEAKRAKI